MYQRISALFCALVVFIASPAFADTNSEIDTYVSKAEQYQSRGRFPEAEIELKSAISLSNSKFGALSQTGAGLCRRLASMYIQENRLSEADRYLRRALIITTGYGPVSSVDGDFLDVGNFVTNSLQHPENLPGSWAVADVLSAYADVFARQNRYTDSARLLESVVKTYEQGSADPNAPPELVRADAKDLLASALIKLGYAYGQASRSTEAETVLKRAVQVTRQSQGTYSKASADAISALARLYRAQGRDSEAKDLDDEAAQARKMNLSN